ncbi:hypothetical protein ACFLYA_01450 [Candidatus Dependentiae bacterium]
MVNPGDTFKIGEICPESGVYRVKGCGSTPEGKCTVSEDQHTIPLVKGKKFPPCKGCENGDIRWEFVKKA